MNELLGPVAVEISRRGRWAVSSQPLVLLVIGIDRHVP